MKPKNLDKTRYLFIKPQLNRKTEMSSQIEIAITKSMETAFVSTIRDTAKQLSEKFGFSYEEALKALEIDPKVIMTNGVIKPKKVKETEDPITSRELKFPLPFSGRSVVDSCSAVLYNSGLFSQCLNKPSKSDFNLCLKCSKQALDGKPPYGFIQERIDQGDDYVDPKKGSRPVHFTKVMKKFQLTREVVENEVSRLQIPFDTEHFVEPESKRGRPKKDGPILMPMPKSKKASKNISVELPEDMSSLSVELPEDMSSLSGSEDDSSSKKSKSQKHAEKEQKRAEKEEAEEHKRIEKETARKAKEEAEELKRIEKETARKAKEEADELARKAKEVARKDAEKTKEEIKLMGKEDANSKKFEKVTKRAATMKEKKEKKEKKGKKETKVELPAKELEQEEEQITPPAKTPVQDDVQIATPAKEQEEQIDELQGSPSPSKQEEQLAQLLLQEEEKEEEDQIQYATQPKKTFDVIIQGVAYLFQNGFIFHKDKSNTYAGTYNLETKEFQFDEDEELDEEEEDDEEEDEVSSQTEDEDDT